MVGEPRPNATRHRLDEGPDKKPKFAPRAGEPPDHLGKAQDGLTNAISGKESNRYARQVMDGRSGLDNRNFDRL